MYVIQFNAANDLRIEGYKTKNKKEELISYSNAWHKAFEVLIKLCGIWASYSNSYSTKTYLGDDYFTFEMEVWIILSSMTFFNNKHKKWYSIYPRNSDIKYIKELYKIVARQSINILPINKN